MAKPVFECSCENCAQACTVKPGLFMPGQAERLAAYAGWSFDKLFAECLAIERVPCEPSEILVLRPATEESGACVFYMDGRCAIHAMEKPYECAMATHEGGASLAEIVNAWVPYQDALRERIQ